MYSVIGIIETWDWGAEYIFSSAIHSAISNRQVIDNSQETHAPPTQHGRK